MRVQTAGSSTGALKVYFDGLCPLCSREISYYRKKAPATTVNPIEWVDITADGFDAAAEGLDPEKVHRYFHVKNERGEITVGVDAFIEIWARIPALRTWKAVSNLPGAKSAMKLGYAAFARIRPFLPRRKRLACADGSCA
jgi:predicted DCC family thiol-disulfide oxidoreductase YuxK